MPASASSLTAHLARFAGRRVLVAGDVILDHYVRGSVSRVSPEAPVPVLAVEEESYLAGGAANVARNLAALGARVELAGLRGDDEAGERLADLLREAPPIRGVLFKDKERPTILKTRCVAGGQQMLRLDRERAMAVAPTQEKVILGKLLARLDSVEGLLLSDYGKGFLTPRIIAALIAAARKRGVPVFVDPKGMDYSRYRGATVLTPNLREAQEASGVRIDDDASLARAAATLQRAVQGDAIVITRGAHGVSVFPKKGRAVHAPAQAREVYDVTGAGDTFIAVSALAHVSGASIADAARLGNAAAGIVVGRAGVASVTHAELALALQDPGRTSKVRTVDYLRTLAREYGKTGRKLVFTNGYFDLLHAGHVRFLEAARGLGDALAVAINSDASVRRTQGAPRPILSETERLDLLGALPFVDHLLVFGEDTPVSLLRTIQPQVLVKGGRGNADRRDVVGREIVEGYGGAVRIVPVGNDLSIATLIERANAARNNRRNG